MIWHAELLPELLGFNRSSAGFGVLEMLPEQPFLGSRALDPGVVSACPVLRGRLQPGLGPFHPPMAVNHTGDFGGSPGAAL